MEIFTEDEMKTMAEFDCSIHKLCYSWNLREEELELTERFGEDVSNGLPYIEKNYAEERCRMKLVVVFQTEEGMNRWMKCWPLDQQFIERDFIR